MGAVAGHVVTKTRSAFSTPRAVISVNQVGRTSAACAASACSNILFTAYAALVTVSGVMPGIAAVRYTPDASSCIRIGVQSLSGPSIT